MNTQSAVQYPQADRRAYLWLALGAVLLVLSTGQFRLGLFAWVAPVFLIRFYRTQRAGRGYWILLLVLYAAYGIAWQGILGFMMPLGVYLIFNILITLIGSLPFLADRLLAPRIRGFSATLIYPLSVTAVYYLYNLVSLMGSFGTPGYEQYNNLALIQLVSVTGLWGLAFLVHWLGPLVNWAWERSFRWPEIWRGLAVWAGVLSLVFAYGGLRLAFAQSPQETVQVHGFSPLVEEESEAPDLQTDLEGFRSHSQSINEILIAGAVREARRGAQIVLWPEMAGGGVEEDAQALIARAQELARQEKIYLAMGIEIFYPDQNRPWENKLVVIDPAGDIILNHDKFGATFLYSMLGAGEALQGEYAMHTVQTPFGSLTGAVCWDADFPMTMKQAGKQQAGLMLLPTGDPGDPTATLHAQQAIFRAIENGFSLVRHDYLSGWSVAVDPYGRVLAMVDVSAAAERTMVAQVPTRHVFTLYPIIGDLFAWLALAGIIGMVVWAVVKRQPRAGK